MHLKINNHEIRVDIYKRDSPAEIDKDNTNEHSFHLIFQLPECFRQVRLSTSKNPE